MDVFTAVVDVFTAVMDVFTAMVDVFATVVDGGCGLQLRWMVDVFYSCSGWWVCLQL